MMAGSVEQMENCILAGIASAYSNVHNVHVDIIL